MDRKIEVKNRSNSTVVYSIPELNIRREYAPGETKHVSKEEVEGLSYRPGGKTMIERFLIIGQEVLDDLSVRVEPEYWLDDEGVKQLLLTGTMNEFLDCLDFAPAGVIDLVKKYAVDIPLNDVSKRKALLEKTGFDVDMALLHLRQAAEGEDQSAEKPAAPQRRTNPGRRTTPSYKVVSTPKGV